MRLIGGLGLLLFVAACAEEQPLPPERPDAGPITKSTMAARPRHLDLAGRWAVKPDMCTTGWWDFGGDEIRTAGELGCSVVQDERTETSATLRLTCVGEGMPSDETWRVAGTPERITVDRPSVGQVTLIKCAG